MQKATDTASSKFIMMSSVAIMAITAMKPSISHWIGLMTKIVRTCSLRSDKVIRLRKSSMMAMEKESSLLFLMDSLGWVFDSLILMRLLMMKILSLKVYQVTMQGISVIY